MTAPRHDATVLDRFRFGVERGKVREFCRAAWDGDSRLEANAEPDRQIAAPMTFLAAASSIAGRPHFSELLTSDVSRSLHAHERIMARRRAIVGETLDVSVMGRELTPHESRRHGRMRRLRLVSCFSDGDGHEVATVERTVLEAPQSVAISPEPSAEALETYGSGVEAPTDPVGFSPLDPHELEAGATAPGASFGPLTRTDFVRYVLASGDLTAVHHDELAARAAGARTVFAMGMLSAAFVGHVLDRWIALDGGYELELRFLRPVWPGDTLTVAGEVAEVRGSSVRVRLECHRAAASVTVAEAVLGGE